MGSGAELHQICTVDEENDLGIMFSCDFKFRSHIHKMVQKANKFLGVINWIFKYLDPNIMRLNLPSLQYRRLRMDLIMTYKILHGTVHLRKDHFFTMNTNPTRTNGLKIYKHHCNKSLRRYSFSQRIIDHYPLKLSMHQIYYHLKLN